MHRYDSGILIEQNLYTSRLSPKISRNVSGFATARGREGYATACTRPEQSCALNQASQTLASKVGEEACDNLAVAIEDFQRPQTLEFPSLDLKIVEVRAYADAGFSNNRDLSSQLGFTIYLTDHTNTGAMVQWSSRKSKRVTRSTMAAEVFALGQAFDHRQAIRELVSEIMGHRVPLQVFTDSQTSWDAVTSLRSKTERQL